MTLDVKNVKFGFRFNGDELDKFDVPIPYPDIDKIMIGGDMAINFVGFTDPGTPIQIRQFSRKILK